LRAGILAFVSGQRDALEEVRIFELRGLLLLGPLGNFALRNSRMSSSSIFALSQSAGLPFFCASSTRRIISL